MDRFSRDGEWTDNPDTHKKGGRRRNESNERNGTHTSLRATERDEIVFCVGEMPNWKMSKDDGGLVSLSFFFFFQLSGPA
jgi:hypothetical protein